MSVSETQRAEMDEQMGFTTKGIEVGYVHPDHRVSPPVVYPVSSESITVVETGGVVREVPLKDMPAKVVFLPDKGTIYVS